MSRSQVVTVIYGTRPEIIKLGPLIARLGGRARLVNTGQHFDDDLSAIIAHEFHFPPATLTLGVGGLTRGAQIASTLSGLDSELNGSDVVVVQGDTNSALGGALAANSVGVPLVHVESGLRSNDRRMPEEHNRVLIDHLADLCCAPTEGNVVNLKSEAIEPSRVLLTGNTIVEALRSIAPASAESGAMIESFGLRRHGYVLATLHRPENVDDPTRLEKILETLSGLSLPVVLPIHPRTRATVERGGISPSLGGITVLSPLGYRTFLGLMRESAVVVSDSGGIQEEASILKVPLIVLRRSTERPEVIGTFASITADPLQMGSLTEEVIEGGAEKRDALSALASPFGDGTASDVIVEAVKELADHG